MLANQIQPCLILSYDSNCITSGQGKTKEMVKGLVVSRDSDGGEGRLNSKWKGMCLGQWNYSALDCISGYMTLHICQSPHNFAAQRVNLNLCKISKTNLEEKAISEWNIEYYKNHLTEGSRGKCCWPK